MSGRIVMGEMTMRVLGVFLAATAVTVLGSPAVAQPVELKARPGKDWQHKPSGVTLPGQLSGLDRTGVTGFGGAQTDIGGNYWSKDGSENVTIYLYRKVSADVPVWFDRARSAISLLPEKYPDARGSGVRAFTPRGQSTSSGLMEVLTTRGRFRATGLMVFPVNGFYAKVRVSSISRDAAGLEQLMMSAVNAIDWKSRRKEVAAAPVAECPAKLPDRSPAKLATLKESDRMMSAMIGGIVAQAAALKDSPTASTFCREPGPTTIPYGIYRPNASNDHYMMALSDAGRAIFVGSSDLTQILSEMKTAPRFSVTRVDMEKTSTFGDFETLPLPDQALEMVARTAPLSVASTWGDQKRNLTINMSQ